MKNIFKFSTFLLFLIVVTFQACLKDEEFLKDSELTLRFSRDTILFDTSFTTIGSAVRVLKVFNDHDKPLKIKKISLRNTTGSVYALNVDGISGLSFEDVRINAHDSIYIFAKININPDLPVSISPFIITDYIDFEGSSVQTVVLQGWGQNANYITSKDFKGQFSVLTCDLKTITWDDPKPYVIYGIVIIDSCTINMPPGCRVYIHGGLARIQDQSIVDGRLIFVNRSKLNILGTVDQPVYIQGDRLEPEYADVPGQWGGLHFSNPNQTNVIKNLRLLNADLGIRCDSGTTLILDHTIINNSIKNSIQAAHANIDATNCLFSNTIGSNIFVYFGGNYNFKYCTIPNNSNQSFAIEFSDNYCYKASSNCIKWLNRLHIRAENCIFTGTETDEIIFYTELPESNAYFKNCYIKGDDISKDPFFQEWTSNVVYQNSQDKIYIDEVHSNFLLDSLSKALGIGIPISGVNDDLLGNPRPSVQPDAGCFERAD